MRTIQLHAKGGLTKFKRTECEFLNDGYESRATQGPFKNGDTVAHLIVLIEVASAAANLTVVKVLSCTIISCLILYDPYVRTMVMAHHVPNLIAT